MAVVDGRFGECGLHWWCGFFVVRRVRFRENVWISARWT